MEPSHAALSGPFCQHEDCGAALPADNDGVCPACLRNTGKLQRVMVGGEVHTTANMTWNRTRIFYERRPRWLAITLAVGVAVTVAGLYVAPMVGAVMGVASVVAGLFLPAWREKVREVTHGS
jgi:hypothetical protein